MLLVVILVLLFSVSLIAINRRNHYALILSVHFFAVSSMIIVGIIYLSKVSQYRFPVHLDYGIFLHLHSVKITIKNISRLYNIGFALFMFSSVLYLTTVSRYISIPGIILSLVSLFGFLYLNDYNTTYNMFVDNALNGYNFWYMNQNIINYFVFLYHIVVPIVGILWQIFNSQIYIRRRHLSVLLLCFCLMNGYVYYAFTRGIFRTIFFANINAQKIPITITAISNYIFPAFSLLIIVGLVSFLLIKMFPMNFWIFSNIRENMLLSKLFRKNIGMIMHIYKNAFVAVEQRLYLIKDNIERKKYAKIESNANAGIETINEYMSFLDDTLKIFKNSNYSKHEFYLEEVLKKAIISAECEEITVLKCDPKIKLNGSSYYVFETFVNLLSNSKTALDGRENKHISVKAIVEKPFCMVSVYDNGVGIDKKDIKNIFDMFYSTKNKQFGGIGLCYVKTIIRLMGGYIRVLSKKDKFCEFQLIFNIH